MLKFIYSEKATKFYKISTLLLSYVVPVKIKVEISQNFVTFSKYMNFTYLCRREANVTRGTSAFLASQSSMSSRKIVPPLFLKKNVPSRYIYNIDVLFVESEYLLV